MVREEDKEGNYSLEIIDNSLEFRGSLKSLRSLEFREFTVYSLPFNSSTSIATWPNERVLLQFT